MNNFIKPGLEDLFVSRSNTKWGVPVEFDPGHVIYVWIDALSNYITLLGYNPDNAEQPELFNKYWSCDLHIIGKDIMRFHAVYLPVILWGLGLELPKKILGHPWVLFNDTKMSKSKGNVIYTNDVIERFGADALRYYLLSEVSFDRDGSFTYSSFIKIYNAELANTLGNLVSRTLAMTKQYFGGIIPEAGTGDNFGEDLRETVVSKAADYAALMNEYKTSDAIREVVGILYRANKYIDETEPWVLAKDPNNKPQLGTVLYNLLETIRIAAILLSPVIPETCEKIFAQINSGVKEYESAFVFGGLKSGVSIGKPENLFARLDENKIFKDLEKDFAEPNKQTEQPKQAENPGISEITIDDFMKTELKIAQILECEKVEKSDKLLKLRIDLGYEKRQIVSGIAQFYTPDDLIGKKIIVVSNLKPAKLRGIESQGMLLASNEISDGKENVRVIFADENAEIGSRVR
jgi:methionyl-tRNA synthetase